MCTAALMHMHDARTRQDQDESMSRGGERVAAGENKSIAARKPLSQREAATSTGT